jgi:hypothetical protein
MLRTFLKWTALFFLVIESLELIGSLLIVFLKVAEPNDALSRASWGEIAIEIVLRLAIVGLILSAYLHLRRISQLPVAITRQSALQTTLSVQNVLLAAIALFVLQAEKIVGQIDRVPFLSVWTVSALAIGTVCTTLLVRRTLLYEANEELRRDPHDRNGLSQWRRATILSMIMAMSIGLYGFMLRIMGNARAVAWPFYIVSVALPILWRPHLDHRASSTSNPFSNEKDFSS